MSLLRRTKDRVIAGLAINYLNRTFFAPFGQVTELRLDTATKKIFLRAELKGEATPIAIELIEYHIRPDGDRYLATFRDLHTSREWLTILARQQLLRQPLEIPAEIGRWLDPLL